MSASYKKIDYRLRPAKYAERLMVSEAAGRLRFHDPASYRYVGLGSIHFTDFKLMHRTLGVSSMISIEVEEADEQRFEFNKPYAPITIEYGTTDNVLPRLDWEPTSVVWLDYDDQLSIPKLLDVDLLIRKASSGSFLIFSVNAEPPAPPGTSRGSDLVANLKLMVGNERVDPAWKAANLQGWAASKVYSKVLANTIEAALASYNAVTSDPERHRRWQQVLNIEYKDGARMLTVGGIVYECRHEAQLRSGAFDRLSFFRPDEATYRIEVPRLTLKEMGHLEKEILHNPDDVVDLPWLTPKEKRQFLQLYRYFPNFVPAEL